MSETRKQIIEKIGAAENILITVSKSPNVDALAAALGLTIALNKSGKRATAVTSGKMPDALEFLRPEKTFENSVDSLRDFIIALNKEKADHLRYKVVGDHVKIFITPYRTTLTSKDLEFEQGDFNVDLVLALGVRDKSDLDSALAAHGRIFHDATVGVLTVGDQASSLSDINWHNFDAGSLSEIALELILELDSKLLNKSVATAFLTGIVAETDRFSNAKASANVMNLASKLIIAGADQQLVISKIKEAEEKNQPNAANQADLKDQPEAQKPSNSLHIPKQPLDEEPEQPASDSISINHAESEATDELEKIETEITDIELANEEKPEDIIAPKDNFEESLTPELPQVAPLDLSAVEIAGFAPQAEIDSNNQPAESSEETPKVVAPIDNFAPQIPDLSAPLADPSAFISEEPVAATNFKPAARPDELNKGDDYFHPEANQQAKAKILKHTSPINPEQTAPRVQAAPDNQEIIPGAQNPGIGQTIQPIPPVAESPAAAPTPAETQTEPVQLPAAEAYGGFPPPPPPIPDFSNMPLPPEFNLPPVAPINIQPEVAIGVEASAKNIMPDQIYPTPPNNDPGQFKIPGMQ